MLAKKRGQRLKLFLSFFLSIGTIFCYTKLVFFSTRLLTAPKPNPKPVLPARQSTRCNGVALSGLTIGAILNRNIPIPSESRMESQSLFFAMTLIHRYIETKIGQSAILDSTHIISPNAPKPCISKGSPDIAPPSNAPAKNARTIAALPKKHTKVLDAT